MHKPIKFVIGESQEYVRLRISFIQHAENTITNYKIKHKFSLQIFLVLKIAEGSIWKAKLVVLILSPQLMTLHDHVNDESLPERRSL